MSDYWEYLANTGQTKNDLKRNCEKCHKPVILHGAANLKLPVSYHCKNCNIKKELNK
jgi:hypothetical protein